MQHEQDIDAEALYVSVSSAFEKISKDEDTSFETCHGTLSLINTLAEHVRKEAFFSANEIIEDISTEHMKYLSLDYFAGCIYNKIKAESSNFNEITTARSQNLQSAKDHLYAYIQRCLELGIIGQDEAKGVDDKQEIENMSGEARRQFKITQYKRQREASRRLEELRAKLKQRGDGGDIEEELRELQESQLQVYARQAISDYHIIQQELDMLSAMSSHAIAEASDTRIKQKQAEEDSPGLTVTRLLKVGDEIISKRETIKASVFRPTLAPPTMTLAEFGDIERENALARQQQEQQLNDNVVRSYKQLVADGEEDNDELVDKATIKDREWDEWKADNPRGSGNKMGKRY